MQQTLIALPRLTGDVPGKRPELTQPSSSHQIKARLGATRRGRENGYPGVWFGSRVCILAHEGVHGWREKVRCHVTFRLHPVHVQGRGAGSGSMPHVKSGALRRAKADQHLSRFPVPEPGRAGLGPLWPNRGAGFGSQCIVFRSSPHPSPYKRGIKGL